MADAAESETLYTLTEVSNQTGISMPTLQRYKKLYQDRIPSKGKGRTQRYYPEALEVFEELKKENISRRGRPRKKKSDDEPKKSSGRRKTVRAKRRGRRKGSTEVSDEGLLTLTQIGKLTGISYPTLLRYVRLHLDEIPHEGTGRSRRYKPEAVEVFKRLRSESPRGRGKKKGGAKKTTGKRRGRPPKKAAAEGGGDTGALTARLKDLEKSHKELEKTIARLEKAVNKPFKVTLQRR